MAPTYIWILTILGLSYHTTGFGLCQLVANGGQTNITLNNETQCINITRGDLFVPLISRNDNKCTLSSQESFVFNAEARFSQNEINLTVITASETRILSNGDTANFSFISLLEFRPIAGELRIHITEPQSRWFLMYVACSLWNGTDLSFTASYGRLGTITSPPSTEVKQKNSNLAGISVVPILLSGGVIVAVFICIRRKKRKEDKEKALKPPAIGIDNKIYQRDSMTQETEDVYLEIPDPVSEPPKGNVPQCGELTYSVVNKESVKNNQNTPQSTAPTTEEVQCNTEDQSHVYTDETGSTMGVSPTVDEGTAVSKGSAEHTSVYDLAKEVKQPQQSGNNDHLLIREDNANTNASGTTSENTVMVDNDVYRQSVYGESGVQLFLVQHQAIAVW